MTAKPYCDFCLDVLSFCPVEGRFQCDCPTSREVEEAARQEAEDMEHDHREAA